MVLYRTVFSICLLIIQYDGTKVGTRYEGACCLYGLNCRENQDVTNFYS